ncbi:MAG: type II toxin-antitoxin system prevent-host-death family antitoxin [Vicinamibacteria bacterium]
MSTVNIYDAKTRLSSILKAAEAGEEFVIARAGRPIARVTGIARPSRKRKLGVLDGRFQIPDDFNRPLTAKETARFEGR